MIITVVYRLARRHLLLCTNNKHLLPCVVVSVVIVVVLHIVVAVVVVATVAIAAAVVAHAWIPNRFGDCIVPSTNISKRYYNKWQKQQQLCGIW